MDNKKIYFTVVMMNVVTSKKMRYIFGKIQAFIMRWPKGYIFKSKQTILPWSNGYLVVDVCFNDQQNDQ